MSGLFLFEGYRFSFVYFLLVYVRDETTLKLKTSHFFETQLYLTEKKINRR